MQEHLSCSHTCSKGYLVNYIYLDYPLQFPIVKYSVLAFLALSCASFPTLYTDAFCLVLLCV